MRKTFKLQVKEDFVDGVSEFYFTIPDEIIYNMKFYPGDEVTWEVNGDSIIVYKDVNSSNRLR